MTMPDNDGVSEIEVSGPQESEGNEMAESAYDLAGGVMHQITQQLAQSGNIAQNNFITVQKAQDYDYLEGKRIVSLDEAVGVREVQSARNPGGPLPREA